MSPHARLKLIKEKLLPEAQAKSRAANKQLSALENEAQRLALTLVKEPKDQPTVTDHAIVRYLERVKGIDLDAIRYEILNPTRRKMIESGVKIIDCGTYTLKIQDKAVVTIT